jgi:hypothetical protein
MNDESKEPGTAETLKPETMAFVRGLVEDFYNEKEFQISTENNDKWQEIVQDLITSAKSGKLEKKIIRTRDGEEDYLIRYYLINERPKLRVTLHNTLLSDDAALHDHPWHWASLMLTGGYYEDKPEGRKWWAPGSFRTNPPEALHRLEVKDGVGEVWTLFFMGEKEKDWGFLREDGSIQQWQQYLKDQTGVWHEDQ